MLQSLGSQRVGHDSATELNWLAALGLSCGRQDLHCGAGFSVKAPRLSSCVAQF